MFDISRFLGGFDFNVITTAVGTSAVLIAPANPMRPILYVTNPSATIGLNMFIDPVPLPGSPHIIIPPAQTQAFTWIIDGPMSTYPWLASFPSGSATIIVTEITWKPSQVPGG